MWVNLTGGVDETDAMLSQLDVRALPPSEFEQTASHGRDGMTPDARSEGIMNGINDELRDAACGC